jgi:tetratricopeptide (TPR) repeat protein
LTVWVRENDQNGAPLAGVQIQAPKANPAVTDSTGKKTLTFPEHQVGDRLKLGLFKEGYEVVNHIQLEVTLPRDANSEEHFFLCKSERCPAARLSFYQLRAEAQRLAVEESYWKKLQTLESQGKANAQELARAQGERDQALATVNRLIEELAQLKPSEGSAMYRRAAQLFSEGKPDEALAELDQAKLQRERERARAAQEAADRELEGVAEGFVLRGNLLVLQLKFDEAEHAYEEAAITYPESFDAAFALAGFARNQYRYEKASIAYESALALARKQGPALVAKVQNDLGILYTDQNRQKDARHAFEEALDIYRKLVKKDPEVYTPELAATLNNLGILHSEQNRKEEARAVYGEALTLQRDLAKKNPQIHLPQLATTLINFGSFLGKQHRNEDARAAYDEALIIHRKMANKEPFFLNKVAATLNNLGILLRELNRNEDARVAYEEALDINRELAKRNPEAFLPDVATTLLNLGLLHSKQHRREDARAVYEEALGIFSDLAKKSPKIFLPDMAKTLNALGRLLHQFDAESASIVLAQELAARRQMKILGLPSSDFKLALMAGSLAVAHAQSGHAEQAMPAAQEALSMIRDLDAAEQESLSELVATLRAIVEPESMDSAHWLFWTRLKHEGQW